MKAYANLMESLWTNNDGEVVSPKDFKNIIDPNNNIYRIGVEHDNADFLLFLLNGLHDDLIKNDIDSENESVIVKLFQVFLIFALNGHFLYIEFYRANAVTRSSVINVIWLHQNPNHLMFSIFTWCQPSSVPAPSQ